MYVLEGGPLRPSSGGEAIWVKSLLTPCSAAKVVEAGHNIHGPYDTQPGKLFPRARARTDSAICHVAIRGRPGERHLLRMQLRHTSNSLHTHKTTGNAANPHVALQTSPKLEALCCNESPAEMATARPASLQRAFAPSWSACPYPSCRTSFLLSLHFPLPFNSSLSAVVLALEPTSARFQYLPAPLKPPNRVVAEPPSQTAQDLLPSPGCGGPHAGDAPSTGPDARSPLLHPGSTSPRYVECSRLKLYRQPMGTNKNQYKNTVSPQEQPPTPSRPQPVLTERRLAPSHTEATAKTKTRTGSRPDLSDREPPPANQTGNK